MFNTSHKRKLSELSVNTTSDDNNNKSLLNESLEKIVLEKKLGFANLTEQELRIQLDKAESDRENILQSQANKEQRLKNGLVFLNSQNSKRIKLMKEKNDEINRIEKENEKLVLQLRKQLSDCQNDNSSKSMELIKLRHQMNKMKATFEDEILSLQRQVDILEESNQILRSETEDYEKHQLNNKDDIQEVKQLKDRIFELEALISASTNQSDLMSAYRKELTERANKDRVIRNKLKELNQLRKDRSRLSLVEEELNSCKRKVMKTNDLNEQVINLQLKVEKLSIDIEKWEDVAKPIVTLKTGIEMGIANPAVIKVTSNDLKESLEWYYNEREKSEHRIGELELENLKLSSKCKNLENEYKTIEVKYEQNNTNLEQKMKELNRSQKRLNFVIKERDGLKAILKSYDEEDSLNNHDNERIKRIEELEKTNKYLELSLDELKKENDIVNELTKKNSRLENELVKISQEAEQLQQYVLRGEYNPKTTKILHFKMNPERIAQENRLKFHKNEVSELRKKIQQYDTERTQNNNTMISEFENRKLLDKWAKERENLVKQHDRLKEIFKEKIKEFREATYLLSGYKIEMFEHTPPRYRLRSMYANDPNDCLIFEMSNNTLKALETDFTRELPDEILQYMTRFHSIPAFLSRVTLDLHSKQTTLISSALQN